MSLKVFIITFFVRRGSIDEETYLSEYESYSLNIIAMFPNRSIPLTRNTVLVASDQNIEHLYDLLNKGNTAYKNGKWDEDYIIIESNKFYSKQINNNSESSYILSLIK
jgi:hypothetical protein